MRLLDDLINYTIGIIVILLFLLGSVTEIVLPVIITLCLCLFLAFGALIFFTCAKKKYLKTRTISNMKIVSNKDDLNAA